MKTALLDINALLALAWPNHQHHAAAHRWFAAEAKHGWATCALVEVGFIRLSSNPAYTTDFVTPSAAAELLTSLLTHEGHKFWHSPSASQSIIYKYALGHPQVNDAYLIEIASFNKGTLATFDTRIQAHTEHKDSVRLISF